MARAKATHVVYAEWCPHHVPLAVDAMITVANQLKLQCVLYDIDTDAEALADELVKKYGDWTEDYLVPQAFVAFKDEHFEHVLTGDPRGLEFTRQAISKFLASNFYSEMKSEVQEQRPSR